MLRACAGRKVPLLRMNRDDKYRCQTVVDKYVDFAKQHGSQAQYKNALQLMLPDSSLYDYLDGRIPNPANTYAKIIEITEGEEKQRINKLVGERRTRIGARVGQVTNEVKREVFLSSSLEGLYHAAINWTHDDDTRRMYEERLLQRAYDTLAVLPPNDKTEKRSQVQQLSRDMVVLKHPFALAWKVVLEWRDVEDIGDLEVHLLREYIELFPDDGLTMILQGFLESDASPFPKPKVEVKKADEHDNDIDEPVTAQERLITMTEGLEQSSRALLSQRIMGAYLLHLQEYASAVECSQKALDLLQIESNISGLGFQDTFDAINIVLGTALVHHQTPRNHPRAHHIFESILKRKPASSSALIGTGLILEEEGDYRGAHDFLTQALRQSPNVKIRSEAAWCQALAGDLENGLQQQKNCLQALQASESTSKDLTSEVHYRVGKCIWDLDTSKTARKDRNGAYAHFLASLQANLNFAPAYTSLGVYYADYAKDKARARKCFQKAFELSPSEVEAAERLARAFAEQGDWELVQVVAQRVIGSGKVRPPPGSRRRGLSWPFAALGVCHLNNQEYPNGIVSFQAALRISPKDFHSWIGLGESYHNSGRYVAAIKAFEEAQKLQEETNRTEDSWFSKYMLANVKRELGNFEEAIEGYGEVLACRANEYGISIALLHGHVEHAWACIQLGLFGRAKDNCIKAIMVAKGLVLSGSSTFNLWKTLGDSCAMFSWMKRYSTELPVQELKIILEEKAEQGMYQSVADIDGIGHEAISSLTSSSRSTAYTHTAILAYKRGIFCCSNDVHAQAVAWYNLGWAEYRASISLASSIKKANPQLRAAVRCFKRAIELEAGNPDFWNSLGIVTTQLNPKVAQHAFVRSLHLNDRSAATWTNLGTFYLLQNDVRLANEAFTRGQSTDPEYAHAWLGQGILALTLGEIEEAQSLFTQAFEISDASSLVSKRLYSLSSFDRVLSTDRSYQVADLLQPLFSLHQLRSQTSGDAVFQHLSALVGERIGDQDEPIRTLTEVCASLEAEYEEFESPLCLVRFAQAKADLARVQLTACDFETAIVNAETALDLSADENSGRPDPTAHIRYRLSAHLTCGLAHSANGNMDGAIMMFRAALEESHESPDIVCLLAQVLWAKGGDEEQTVVREQLFDCVQRHPEHASAICLLAVIAILDNDSETLEAVAADLHNLRTREDLEEQQKLKIGHLLTAITRFSQSATKETADDTSRDAELSEATSSIMLSPWATHGWSQMADLTSAEGFVPAEIALLTAKGTVPSRGNLDAESLARAYAGIDTVANGQKAIMIAPWLSVGWDSLT